MQTCCLHSPQQSPQPALVRLCPSGCSHSAPGCHWELLVCTSTTPSLLCLPPGLPLLCNSRSCKRLPGPFRAWFGAPGLASSSELTSLPVLCDKSFSVPLRSLSQETQGPFTWQEPHMPCLSVPGTIMLCGHFLGAVRWQGGCMKSTV